MKNQLMFFVWPGLIAAIILSAFLNKDYDSAEHGYDVKFVQPSDPAPASPSLSCTVSPIQDAKHSESKVYCAHKLTAWPEGVTAWLLLLTLVVVVWQSSATSRAAQASEEQAKIANKTLIAQFRPEVIVRRIELFNGAGNWGIHMEIENIGGTGATIDSLTRLDLRWKVWKERKFETLHTDMIEGFSLEAGDGRGLNILVTDNSRFSSKMDALALSNKEGTPKKYSVQAVGVIRYVDESGAGKKTGFSRFLDFDTMRFVASGNSEDEYQD